MYTVKVQCQKLSKCNENGLFKKCVWGNKKRYSQE